MSTFAIIGGTGVYSPDIFSSVKDIVIETNYGNVNLIKTNYKENTVYFLERHGKGHSVPPHKVNYLGNIAALKKIGVENIFATAAVGSLSVDMPPGTFVIIDQFLDFTTGRTSTYFDGSGGVVHIDMTEPYCPELRNTLINCCIDYSINYSEKGTYVCTQGPRFENKAEINMFRILGGDVVGMTNYPEVVLAREANICYAAIAMVTNFAAGISNTSLTHREVSENMMLMSKNLSKILLSAIEKVSEEKSCNCKYATNELGSLK